MPEKEIFTPSGLRMRRMATRPGILNWLFLPGGPGLGLESLQELLAMLTLPGKAWLVDLSGDGSNRGDAAGAAWPDVLLETTDVLPDCVYVGHSTGGMYLQSVPELEARLWGLAPCGSAPDAAWRQGFAQTALQFPCRGFRRHGHVAIERRGRGVGCAGVGLRGLELHAAHPQAGQRDACPPALQPCSISLVGTVL